MDGRQLRNGLRRREDMELLAMGIAAPSPTSCHRQQRETCRACRRQAAVVNNEKPVALPPSSTNRRHHQHQEARREIA
nr:hypothetical protein Itr_chr02CG13990 [Ipomoea trifida]